MLDKQMKKALPKKEANSPEQDFIDSIYWYSKKPKNPTMADEFGFPAIAFKAAGKHNPRSISSAGCMRAA